MQKYLWFQLSFSQLFRLAFTTGSEGCGLDLPLYQSPGAPSVTVPFQQSNGATRTYLIHIPATYDKNAPTPLIFSFHGRTQNSSYQERLSGFSNPEWNPKAIAVYPQGIYDQWQGDPSSVNVDDIAFVADMIPFFSRTYCLDKSRIFAAGKSNGGGLVNRLACDPVLSTQIAAFAPVSAAFYVPGVTDVNCVGNVPQTVVTPCSPGRKLIPIMEFHGLKDNTIAYTGGPRRGGCLPAILHWVTEWSVRNGLGSDATITKYNDGHVVKYEYAPNTDIQGVVTHFAIENLDHDWPNIKPNGDNNLGTYIDATPMIMDFFERFPL
ncbi:hypothetical protein K3495_g6373 [Podosphaera aphanis]|nr:hypothetical protein K3495_g6373 [Podosphaera aphanis]